ncbi:hypothetical protein LPJ53_000492 [Coemansia erecta]|uniref:WD40 repeat-like protein n=1 Tax=Coemansia erecta TaxID=147472 RepID=A0A9W7Y625_9FUNG|nr:hypothetical protein LPJ53_000492 [Coemansia erecta]
MDYQMAITYRMGELELWNPFSKRRMGVLNGNWDNVTIEHVGPVSPSVLAIINAGVRHKQRMADGGKVYFTKVDWSAGYNRFPKMPIKVWDQEPQPGMGISAIEGIASAASSDGNRVSLYTGDKTLGYVYRRIFDISGAEAVKINEQRLINKHSGSVTALCYVEAGGYVVSGNTAGKLYINDHASAMCTQTIDVGTGVKIGSITRSPFNPHLFMVGCNYPNNNLLIFDNRHRVNRGMPSLSLKDNNRVITSQYIRPVWDAETGLICSPARGFGNTSISVWDPRFVRCGDANKFVINSSVDEVHSVGFTAPMARKGRVMITASMYGTGFMSITDDIL